MKYKLAKATARIQKLEAVVEAARDVFNRNSLVNQAAFHQALLALDGIEKE